MEMEELIERTKNWGITKNLDGSVTHKFKLSLEGSYENLLRSEGNDKTGMEQAVKFFYTAKEAWLKGDLETVADYFGILD